MTDGRRLFRFNLLLGGVALLIVGGLFVRAVAAVSLRPPSAAAIGAACMSVLPKPGIGGVLVLAAVMLGLAVAVRAGRSASRQLCDQQRFLRALGPLRQTPVAGVSVFIFEAPDHGAFCAGLLRPRIFMSTTTIAALSAPQLAAVAAHEAHHQRRRDPLRLYLSRLVADSLFFLPALGRCHAGFANASEIAADGAAVSRVGSPGPLASALLTFGERAQAPGTVGIAPERVDHLAGRPVRWRASRQLARASAASVLALAGLAGAGATLHASAQLNLPLLAAQSCMAVMVAAPLIVGAAAIRWLSPRGRQPRS